MGEDILIAPSILSADFGALADAITTVEQAGADLIHVDVMDGHFVPNLTIGPPVIKALKSCSSVPLDVHLMIDNADDAIDWYLDAGSDLVTVHAEAVDHVDRVVRRIKDAGARAGVSLNPGTPVELLREVLPALDIVLIMSVNPGFGGQSFIPGSVQKIERLAELRDSCGSHAVIAVDGGIDTRTAPLVTAAGARMLIAGSAVFGAADVARAVSEIRTAASSALL